MKKFEKFSNVCEIQSSALPQIMGGGNTNETRTCEDTDGGCDTKTTINSDETSEGEGKVIKICQEVIITQVC